MSKKVNYVHFIIKIVFYIVPLFCNTYRVILVVNNTFNTSLFLNMLLIFAYIF